MDPQPTAPPTRTADGHTMTGHVVVSRGADEHGADVVAVWHVNTEGVSTGAWTRPADALTDAESARRLLALTARRSLAGWTLDPASDLLTELARVAGVEPRDWAATGVTVPAALAEIATVRAGFDKVIAEERRHRPNLVPAEWMVDLPDPVPATPDGLRRHARLVRPPAAPVIADVLLIADLLRWSVSRWKDTMTVLGRREYLQRTFGPPHQLPPGWETRLAGAWATGGRGPDGR